MITQKNFAFKNLLQIYTVPITFIMVKRYGIL